jgi:ferredoxin
MAKVRYVKTGEEVEVEDGGNLAKACEKFGLVTACEDGLCGTCMVNIIDGEENLSELTPQEKDLERDKKHRLGCQCKIKKGTVTVDFDF